MPFAVRIHETGGPEVLRWEDVAVARPGVGEVLAVKTTSGTSGAALGGAPGGIAGVGFAVRNSAVGEGKQVANMNKAVTVLRCADNVIDCSLTVDSSGAHGHGECTDTKGRTYRLMLVPK